MTRPWPTQVSRTWLGHPRKRQRLDDHTRRYLAGYRRVSCTPGVAITALTVDRSYGDALSLGESNLWLQCTTLLAVTAELVLCAPTSELLSHAKNRFSPRDDYQAWVNVIAINHIRNSACHPACPPMRELIAHMRDHDREHLKLVGALSSNWSAFGSRPFAEYALLKLNAIGELCMDRYGL